MVVEALKKVLEPQIEQGLQSIRLTVAPGPGMTPERVLQELLTAEQDIASGNLGSPPGPGD